MLEKRLKVLRVLHSLDFWAQLSSHVLSFLTQQFPQRVKAQSLIVDKRARGDCEESAFCPEMYANKAGWKII